MPKRHASSIRFRCHRCLMSVKARQRQIGERLSCPKCHTLLVVPEKSIDDTPRDDHGNVCDMPKTSRGRLGNVAVPAGDGTDYDVVEVTPTPDDAEAKSQLFITIHCPFCNTFLQFAQDRAGAREICSDCGRALIVPDATSSEQLARRKHQTTSSPTDDYDVGEGVAPHDYEPAMLRPSLELRPGMFDDNGRLIRPCAPRRPYLSGVFGFPFYGTVWPRWFSLCGFGVLSSSAIAIVTAMAGFEAPGYCYQFTIFSGVFSIFFVMWIGAATVNLLPILMQTAHGADREIQWPGGPFVDWFSPSRFLVAPIFWSMTPTILLANSPLFDDLPTSLSVVPFLFLLFPIVQLSVLENGSSLFPLSLVVIRSIFHRPKAWLGFYGVAGVFCAVVWLVSLLMWEFLPVGLAIIIESPLLITFALIYFRLLGRLAWLCGDAATNRATDEEEEGEEESNAEKNDAVPKAKSVWGKVLRDPFAKPRQ